MNISRLKKLFIAIATLGLAGTLGACATQETAPQAPPSPNQAELAVACGGAMLIESVPLEGKENTPTEVIENYLSWYSDPKNEPQDGEQPGSFYPHEHFVRLLTSALEELPEAEKQMGEYGNIDVEVESLGSVELVPVPDGGYIADAIIFYPQDEELCAAYPPELQ